MVHVQQRTMSIFQQRYYICCAKITTYPYEWASSINPGIPPFVVVGQVRLTQEQIVPRYYGILPSCRIYVCRRHMVLQNKREERMEVPSVLLSADDINETISTGEGGS